MTLYCANFSHEFEAGPSGPARSYWDVTAPSGKSLGTLCLHHRDDRDAALTASDIARTSWLQPNCAKACGGPQPSQE